MMTPTRSQIFYARNWPMRLWFAIVPLALGVSIARKYGIPLEPFLRLPSALYAAGAFLFCWLLGFLVAVLTGWFVLGPLYFARGLKNGAPYQAGDEVMILVGPRRGDLVRIEAVLEARDRVRVEGGTTYGYVQVCRVAD